MKFCVLKDRITPDFPVMQMGFAARTHLSEGIHDDCMVSVTWLEDKFPLVIVCLDLLGGDMAFAKDLRTAICADGTVAPEHVLINFSHTHGIVAVTGQDAKLASDRRSMSKALDYSDDDLGDLSIDRAYSAEIVKKAVALVEKCRKQAVEGRIVYRRGSSRFGISRRRPLPDGSTAFAPYDCDDAFDPTLDVFALENRSGAVKAILWNYACHATTCRNENYLITADYPGAVCRFLEAAHPGAAAVFMQGCGADVRPRVAVDGDGFKSCTLPEMEEAAREIVGDVEALLKKPGRVLSGKITCAFDDVKLYTENNPRSWWENIANDPNEPDYRRSAARGAIKRYDDGRIRSYLPYPMTCIKLDDALCIIATPCEIVSDYGKRIRALFPNADIVTLGYCEHILSYIPTRAVALSGGYEAQSFLGAGVTGPYVPEIEDIIIGHAAIMLKAALDK